MASGDTPSLSRRCPLPRAFPPANVVLDRLPTVSASQALQHLHVRGARSVSTGIAQLDQLLAPLSPPGHHVAGGYMRGKVTELFGPSGVGKTAFGIQAAGSALRQGQRVVWMDAACAPLVKHRLNSVAAATDGSLAYVVAPTLAHFLALVMRPPASFIPQNTSLVVVDSLPTLIDNAYPRNVDDRAAKTKTEQARWAAGRRFAVVNDVMAALTRFAALHDIALLLTCQTITRIRGASRAVLVPAISGAEWENGVSTRLVLFRDWVRQGSAQDAPDADRLRRARFVGLVKANGVSLADEGGVGSVVPFTINDCGLCDVPLAADDSAAAVLISPQGTALKRPFAAVDERAGKEPDSDELYGWVEDDQVAAEGLLIDENPVAQDIAATVSPTYEIVQGRNKVTRTSSD